MALTANVACDLGGGGTVSDHKSAVGVFDPVRKGMGDVGVSKKEHVVLVNTARP